ncbi:hypothetical protein VD0004_g3343 [Verticillium dahliae]|nr:hypothetical protein VD0004_g3343 [Verticillium dahliae]PNH69841.1 hypothetical protein VD0001_g7050 [Verticillium dahliae]
MAQELTIKNWDPLEGTPDLTGKVAFITGGNCGLGLMTVKFLALRGAKVYLGTRDEGRTQTAMSALLAQNGAIKAAQLHRVHLDLADVTTAVRAADAFKEKESRLDILIHMAAATGNPRRTKDAWESHIAGDFAFHFLLTNQLLPLLKATARLPGTDVRIVGLTSGAASSFLPAGYKPNFTSRDVLADPAPYYPWAWRWLTSRVFVLDMILYSIGKIAGTGFIRALQRRLDEEGVPVLCTSIHPGEVRTDKTVGSMVPWLASLVDGNFLSLEEGSGHTVFAAAAPQVREEEAKYKGQYLMPLGKVAKLHPLVENDEQIQGLWRNSEAAINEVLAEQGLQEMLPW